MSWSFKRTIIGNLVSMKNGRQMIWSQKKIIKSKKALEFEDNVLLQIGANRIPFEGRVGMWATVWYKNPLSDLDVELLKDILQAPKPPRMKGANVIKDDNQICEMHVMKKLDKKNPRIDVELIELGAD